MPRFGTFRGAALLTAAGLIAATAVQAQDDSLLAYEGADRTARIEAAAKKEGALTLYTAFRPQDLPTILTPFETRYGIKVNVWRSGFDNVLQRVRSEASGGRYAVDAVMMPAPAMEALRREKLLQPVKSPSFAQLLPGAVPAHRQTASVLMNVWVQAYNTQAVNKSELPKTYDELLDPKWKGKLGIEAKAMNWYGTVLSALGEERGTKLFREIAAKNGISARLGMSLLNNMVVAGEVPIALTIYADLPEKAKHKGQPIDWFAIEPIIAEGFDIGVAAKSPHPAAALLFCEYMLSPETQKLLASLYYMPTRKGIEGLVQHKNIKVVDPVAAIDNATKWTEVFDANVTMAAK